MGPYDIVDLIGEGGMGRVYRARDDRLGREVAVKFLAADAGTDPERQRRFLQEARAAGALNHPNIVAVYDVGSQDGVAYIVSELVDGGSLRAELDRAPLTLERALQLAVEIADGLAAAHQAGLVHRDLKPDNIMITRAGRVKIVDFGLAKSNLTPADSLEDHTLTSPHLVMGTASYMSPEQARGDALDFRSDHFSFGAVLYEMLTHQRAFKGGTPIETLSAVLTATPAPLSGACADCPEELVTLVQRCLAKAPEDRYGATTDLLHDLRENQRRLTSPRRTRPRVSGRHRPSWWVAAIGSAAALGAAIATMVWTFAADTGVDLAAYRYIPFATESGYDGSPVWSPPDGRYLAYVGEINGVLQVMVRAVSVAGAAVNSAPPAVQLTDAPVDCRRPFWALKGEAVYFISQAGDRDGLWRVSSAGGPRTLELRDVSEAALAPDGSIVFLRESSDQLAFRYLLWIKPPNGEPRRFAPDWAGTGAIGPAFMRFSPNGSTLALWVSPMHRTRAGIDDIELWLFDYPSARARRVLESLRLPRATSLSWMPDNRHVVFGADFLGPVSGSHLWIGDVRSGRIEALTAMAAVEQDPAVSPDGKNIAFTSDTSNFDVVELPTDGSPPVVKLGSARDEADPVWVSGGRRFAYVTDRSGEPEVWLDDPLTPAPIVRGSEFPDGRTFQISRLAVAPGSGERLIYQRRNLDGYHLWVSTLGGGPPARLITDRRFDYEDSPTWAPDGQSVAFSIVADDVWGLARVQPGTGAAPTIILKGLPRSCDPHWSPSGLGITCQQDDGLYLVSLDGQSRTLLTDEVWLAHDWSGANRLLGLRENEELRMELVAMDVRTGHITVLNRDVGPSPPVVAPMRGFSVSPDGRHVLTALLDLHGDIYLLQGFRQPARSWWPFGGRRP